MSRFDPDGELERAIPLPVSQITNCVFAGAGLDRMFVTSASVGREDEPLAGALFERSASAGQAERARLTRRVVALCEKAMELQPRSPAAARLLAQAQASSAIRRD